MDIQFYGANCISLNVKMTRLVVDDNLSELGKKSVLKDDDVALFTSNITKNTSVKARLVLDSPGEYEVADISIVGIAARAHSDEPGTTNAVMYKVVSGDISVLLTGHIYPEFSDDQLEAIGMIDVLIIPVGGHGYTLDPQGALSIIKELEPKLVIPTSFEDKSLKLPVPLLSLEDALKELGLETKDTVPKLRVKPTDLSDITQLVVLQST